MIEEITIKFGTKLKPTQHSWKSQLYNIYIYIYIYMGCVQVTFNITLSNITPLNIF